MSTEGIQSVIDLLFHRETLLITGAIYTAFRVLGDVKPVARWRPYRTLLPILPEAIGAIVAFCGGLPIVAAEPATIRVAAGIWCGLLASKFKKFLGQTILGDDSLMHPPPVQSVQKRQDRKGTR